MALLGLSDRPKRFRQCIQNTLGLRMRSELRWGGHRHLLETVMGKNRKAGIGILDHVASNRSMGPLAASLEQPRMEQPGILVAHFHSQLEQLCNVLRLAHMPPMLRMLRMP